MRVVNNYGDGLLLETLLIFRDEKERVEYFEEKEKEIDRAQTLELANLRAEYTRSAVDCEDPEALYRDYMQKVNLSHSIVFKKRALLASSVESSVLEEDLAGEKGLGP